MTSRNSNPLAVCGRAAVLILVGMLFLDLDQQLALNLTTTPKEVSKEHGGCR